MWSNNKDHMDSPVRGFWTPPASWRSRRQELGMPLSERKQRMVTSPSGGCVKRDLFHVIHKVPAGDSPYVRAKHVQLIEKDPSKAVSLFWAAINAGDRVDSALKDMAVVMKQLNRSDEAIEAIKSFRHLCPYDSQESIDNVLVELYKRSGRIEEEIEILQRRLKHLEEGIAFGGMRTKTARSQGKKVQITVEQERSRILGNLAWAHLQHHDYGLAEQYYRKALSLEPDENKQCNLAICLMHVNRIPEARSLLQSVKASCGNGTMDESYAKSFERACQILTELDPEFKATEQDGGQQRSSVLPTTRKVNEVVCSTAGERGFASGFMDSRKSAFLSNEQNSGSYWESHLENNNSLSAYNGARTSPQSLVDNTWRRGSYFASQCERSGFASKTKENRSGFTEMDHSSVHKTFSSPALLTQPRRCSWGFNKGDDQRRLRWGDDTERKNENVLKHAARNLSGELLESTDDHKSWRRNVQEIGSQRKSAMDSCASLKCPIEQTILTDDAIASKASIGCGWDQSTDAAGDKSLVKDCSFKLRRKSWADMVEEEEQELSIGEVLGLDFNVWNHDEETNDENLNTNMVHQNSYPENEIGTLSQKLEAFDLQDGYGTARNPAVRRSLSYESGEDMSGMRRNRLQVFRDITPTPDSP